MILLLLAAAAGLYMIGRMTPDGSAAPGGYGNPGVPEPETELGIAEDGSFVIVEKLPDPGAVTVTNVRPSNLGGIALPPFSQPSVSASAGAVGWMPPSVGCAPGKQCCTDCKTAKVRVGEGIGLSRIDGMAAILAQRIHLGDLRATANAVQIFELGLSGRDPQARYVAEALTLALDEYRMPSGALWYEQPRAAFPARLRVNINGE